LVKNGKITRPQLGIKVADISELTSYGRKKLSVPDSVKSGLYVASVTRGSSAASAGVRKGDVIVKADNKKVSDVATLHTILYSHKIGDTITLQVVRNGQKTNLSVTLRK
jgi:serine protease Do